MHNLVMITIQDKGANMKPQTNRKKALARQMGTVQDLMKGSLVRTAVTCGKKNCRCREGKKHPAAYFSYQFQGKQRVIHIPHELVDEVEHLNKNWKELKKIIEELTAENARLVLCRHLLPDDKGKPRESRKRKNHK